MILLILFIIALAAAATVVIYFATKKRDRPGPGPSPGPGPGPSPGPDKIAPADVDIDMFFPPYDCPTASQTMIDVGMISAVTDAANVWKKNGNKKLDHNVPTNPFQIKYSVYNLYDMAYLTPLIAAYNAGVFVQILIHLTEEDAHYNHIFNTLKKAGLQTLDNETQSQRDCNKIQLATLNLIPIDPKGSLMHCKTRYYKFGGVVMPVQIGDKKRYISEAVVTGSFNPECSATNDNEYLLVLSNPTTTTPDTIKSYLRIYDFVKHELAGTKASPSTTLTLPALPAPKDNDPIYNINKALFVCYSGWCQGTYYNTPSYMRYVLADLIDKEQHAIFLPLYSLSNLDSPDKYTNPLVIDGSTATVTPPTTYTKSAGNDPEFFSYTLKSSGLSSKLKNIGVYGIGAQVEIEYTDSSKTNWVIRGPTGKNDSVYLILKSRSVPSSSIKTITVYNSILTHFGNAINRRKVMVFLMINKAQVDGEVANDGTSFTGGDSSLTAFLIQQMGGITWRCKNAASPTGELHSKSGYFYSQNTLITDTTNWSNAGMGYQGKSGPNCSNVNNETCLVIKGDYLKDEDAKQIFKIRVLANIMNTARMYAYQQYCPIADSTFGGGSSVTINPNINCECPQADVSCDRSDDTLKGTCSMANSEEKHPSPCFMEIGDPCSNAKGCSPGSICYKGKNCVPEKCGGVSPGGRLTSAACITACCLRYGQTPTKMHWDDLTKQIFNLPKWPQITTSFGTKVGGQPWLGSIMPAGTGKSYIIDPTFNWLSGERTSDKVLLGYLNPKSGVYFKPSPVKNENSKLPIPPQGNFCKPRLPSNCTCVDSSIINCKQIKPKDEEIEEEFIYTRAGVY